ncbi:MAG: hypothetical protein EOO38_28990, partial [Cytophagaceae bacterium]
MCNSWFNSNLTTLTQLNSHRTSAWMPQTSLNTAGMMLDREQFQSIFSNVSKVGITEMGNLCAGYSRTNRNAVFTEYAHDSSVRMPISGIVRRGDQGDCWLDPFDQVGIRLGAVGDRVIAGLDINPAIERNGGGADQGSVLPDGLSGQGDVA